MRTWIAAVVAAAGALSAQACSVMDGENTRLAQDNRAGSADDGGSTSSASGASDSTNPEHRLESADAGSAVTGTVECGSKKCAGDMPFCCATSDVGTCVDAKTSACTSDRFFMRCDDASDCHDGEICCAKWDGTGAVRKYESFCAARSACPSGDNADGTLGSAVLCQQQSECTDGRTCSGWLVDWDDKRLDIKSGICWPYDP